MASFLTDKAAQEMVEELFMEGVSTTLGEQAMLTEVKAAPIVAKFMIASGLLGQFQSVDSVAMGKEQGEEDSKPKPTQDTANVGETGNTSQWPGARSAEVTSHQRTWRTTYAAATKTTRHGARTRTYSCSTCRSDAASRPGSPGDTGTR
ncbi:hypothetical protein PDIDSM_2122 [Penicillium digitatum]|nr:hypothetical protein PDIDSM_2122 [Penicillium digitatum]